VQCSAVKCSVVQCSAVQCSAVQRVRGPGVMEDRGRGTHCIAVCIDQKVGRRAGGRGQEAGQCRRQEAGTGAPGQEIT
jgi:hypothetical protein